MAPFGRNFLKARLRNRSDNKDRALPAGEEIQVWVCQEEKVVCGVSKHTTCADVVQALLEDHKTATEDKRSLQGEPKEFCLLERWKGFERALPPLTRIIRLWNAWGDEKPFVQFVLVKVNESVTLSSKRSSKPKGPLSKSKRWEQGPVKYVNSLPVDRQKRMVRKAFRKLEKIHKDRTPTQDRDEEGISSLVQLIIAQDHTIRQQIHRMSELDLEIERIEWESSASPDQDVSPRLSFSDHTGGQLKDDQLQEYLYSSNGIDQLETQLRKHRDLIEKLSHDIDSEIKSRCITGTQEPQGAAASMDFDAVSGCNDAELERLRWDLEHSMRRGLALQVQATELEKELNQNEGVLSSKSQECEHLAMQLSYLCIADSAAYTISDVPTFQAMSCSVQNKLGQILSQTDAADTDSDTGISSTHSQDSLSPYGDIPHLDTDV
ncbi:hypothetical protein SKAU_G00026200 [Synaphobranchus kaupii]|uniref:Ras-associating domain-containing protein n=1 Tax=Synaphobranchus kaupii TaxID=118154 RepID=A0A9Q1GEP0_SYNKA|nr:hypothetical protein SKAU_G00026200 [Synaphobranchus kaupii]